jgi:sec-independent protein translocase protein TatB
MLDLFDPSKIFIVGVVALIVIGPKELPRVMRTVGQVVGRMRRMAAEFQQQFNEAMREAELDDVRKELAAMNEAATVDVSSEIEAVNKELTAAGEAAKADVSFDPARLTQHDNVRPLEAEPLDGALEPPAPMSNGAAPDGVNGSAAPVAEEGGTRGEVARTPGEALPAHPQLADDVVRESGAP